MAELANLKNTSKQEAVKQAVQAELKRAQAKIPLQVKFARLRALNPLPPATGPAADKNFFDGLSGDP